MAWSAWNAWATDDGACELRVTEVPLEGGGADLKCVVCRRRDNARGH